MSSKLKDLGNGFKSLLQPKVLLVILVYVANQYGNNMMNGFQSKLATGPLGIGADVVGIAVTVFTLAGLIMRSPSGYIADKFDVKKALIICFLMKIGVCILYGIIPVQGAAMYLFVRFMHGVVWSMVGCVTVAMLGKYVDKRAAGTAYALMMALSTLCCSTARPLALTLLDSKGGRYVAFATAAVSVIPIIFTFLIKSEPAAERKADAGRETKKEKKSIIGFFTGSVLVYMIPLGVLSAIPMLGYNAEMTYLPQLAEELGLEYLTTLTAAAAISCVVVLVSGMLCDIMSPYIVLTIMLILNGAGLYMMGSATSTAALSAGIWMYYLGRSQFQQFTVIGMKCVSKSQQGAWQGTMNLCKDFLTMFWGGLLGSLIVNNSYAFTFKVCGIISLVTIVLVWVSKILILDKFTKRATENNA